MINTKLQDKYLPFSKKELLLHFTPLGKNTEANINHLNYYIQSINNYENYKKDTNNIFGKHLYETSKPCQIQKDERFWTVNTLMNIYYSSNRVNELCILFEKAFGKKVPISIETNNWEECLTSVMSI